MTRLHSEVLSQRMSIMSAGRSTVTTRLSSSTKVIGRWEVACCGDQPFSLGNPECAVRSPYVSCPQMKWAITSGCTRARKSQNLAETVEPGEGCLGRSCGAGSASVQTIAPPPRQQKDLSMAEQERPRSPGTPKVTKATEAQVQAATRLRTKKGSLVVHGIGVGPRPCSGSLLG